MWLYVLYIRIIYPVNFLVSVPSLACAMHLSDKSSRGCEKSGAKDAGRLSDEFIKPMIRGIKLAKLG